MFLFRKKKSFDPPVVVGSESMMSKKAHGTCERGVQEKLKWNASRTEADKICCFNRHYAEHSGYFLKKTTWLEEMKKREKIDESFEYYDSVTGKLLFTAPKGRSFEEFLTESKAHGWPSFRDNEVNWEVVRVLPNGETISVDGTHLGHNLPDKKGNRYCINLVCIAGYPENEAQMSAMPILEEYQLLKNSSGCTGMFWRPDPRPGYEKKKGGNDWPRDDAFLKGVVYEVDGKKWLQCVEVKQSGDKEYKKASEGAWMPFEYHQYYLKKV